MPLYRIMTNCMPVLPTNGRDSQALLSARQIGNIIHQKVILYSLSKLKICIFSDPLILLPGRKATDPPAHVSQDECAAYFQCQILLLKKRSKKKKKKVRGQWTWNSTGETSNLPYISLLRNFLMNIIPFYLPIYNLQYPYQNKHLVHFHLGILFPSV